MAEYAKTIAELRSEVLTLRYELHVVSQQVRELGAEPDIPDRSAGPWPL